MGKQPGIVTISAPNPLFPFILLSPISSHALALFRRYPSRFDPQPFISISTRQSSRSTTTTAQSWSSYSSRSTHAYPTPLLSRFMIWYSFQQQSLYLTRETRELLNVHSLIFIDSITSSPFPLFNKQSHYCLSSFRSFCLALHFLISFLFLLNDRPLFILNINSHSIHLVDAI